MKRLFWTFLVIFLITGSGEAHNARKQGKFSLFYSSLSPHGEWISLEIGRAWRPYNVGHQWRPYRDGRWIWTDYGWYWVSHEPFGWATYHYGRWLFDDYYGWIWVPDDVWGPAWVEWRYDNDYIGWAPLPPHARFSLSVGITFGNAWVAPVHYWNFVPCGNFSSVHITNYIQPVNFTKRIIGRTRHGGRIRAVNNRIVNEGVGRDHIERRTRRKIGKVDVVERRDAGTGRLTRKGNRDRLEVYRPGPDDLRKEGNVRTQTGVTNERKDRRTEQNIGKRGTQRSPAEIRKGRTSQRDQGSSRQQRQQPRIRTDRTEKKAAKPDGRSVKQVPRTTRPDGKSVKQAPRTARPDRKSVKPRRRPNKPDGATVKSGRTIVKPDGRSGRPGFGAKQKAYSGKSRPDVRGKAPTIGKTHQSVKKNQPAIKRNRPSSTVTKPAARPGRRKKDG